MTAEQVAELLDEGGIVIDGGNFNDRDDVRRVDRAPDKGIQDIDAGVNSA